MPITNPALPLAILEELSNLGIRFAVLHREEEIGTSSLESDLDLVVNRPGDSIINGMTAALEARHLHPVMKWRYDIGGALTYFICSSDGRDGLQADFLHDPQGRGRYGLRSEEILKEAVPGNQYPVPSPLDQRLYLIRKRWCKGQWSAVDREVKEALAIASAPAARQRARSLFSPAAARSVAALLEARNPTWQKRQPSPRQIARLLGRVSRPVGFWAELVGPPSETRDLAAAVLGRFRRWAIHAGEGERPPGAAGYAWWARQVLPVKLRAGVYLSYSEIQRSPRPDLVLAWDQAVSTDSVARTVVRAMADRIKT